MATGPDGIKTGPVTPVLPALPAADARQDEFARSLQFMLGRDVKAAVLSRFGDGTYLVRVDQAAMRMQLPSGTRPGDTMQMTLRSITPRPTFELGAEHGHAQAIALADASAGDLPDPAALARQLARSAPQAYAQQSAIFHLMHDSGARAAQAGALVLPQREEPLTYSRTPSAPLALFDEAAGGGPDAPAGQLPASAAGGAAGSAAAGAARAAVPLATLQAQAQLQQALGGGDGDASTQLSSAGRLINQVLQAAQQNGSPQAVIGRAPIVGSGGLLPEQMAAALHDTLSRSGVFYESHLREWVDGRRSFDDVAREPQAAGPGRPQPAGGDAAEARAAPQEGAAADDGAPATREAGTREPVARDPVARDPIAFTQLVNVQLGALENHAVQWQGQLWPGQQMEWEVRREADPDGRGQGQDEEQRGWQSSMRLHFPALGRISATVRLVGDAVHVQVDAADPATAGLLAQAREALAGALDAAGSPLHSFLVKNDAAA